MKKHGLVAKPVVGGCGAAPFVGVFVLPVKKDHPLFKHLMFGHMIKPIGRSSSGIFNTSFELGRGSKLRELEFFP